MYCTERCERGAVHWRAEKINPVRVGRSGCWKGGELSWVGLGLAQVSLGLRAGELGVRVKVQAAAAAAGRAAPFDWAARTGGERWARLGKAEQWSSMGKRQPARRSRDREREEAIDNRWLQRPSQVRRRRLRMVASMGWLTGTQWCVRFRQ